jgi:hypothetical protein
MKYPQVGMPIWFHPSVAEMHSRPLPTTPFPGWIAFVHDVRHVNLFYLDHLGRGRSAEDVKLVHPSDIPHYNRYCEFESNARRTMPMAEAGVDAKHAQPQITTVEAGQITHAVDGTAGLKQLRAELKELERKIDYMLS